jgi:hypothetical protein
VLGFGGCCGEAEGRSVGVSIEVEEGVEEVCGFCFVAG